MHFELSSQVTNDKVMTVTMMRVTNFLLVVFLFAGATVIEGEDKRDD